MGGKGSGRPPKPENIVKRFNPTPIASAGNEGFYLPNYSAVANHKKTLNKLDDRYILSGSESIDSKWEEGSNNTTYLISGANTISGAGLTIQNVISGGTLITDRIKISSDNQIEYGNSSEVTTKWNSANSWYRLISSGDVLMTLGDNTGTNKFDITDSGGVSVFTIDSDGNLTNQGSGHDGFSDFVANEHIDWTNTNNNLNTSGNISGSIITADSRLVISGANSITLSGGRIGLGNSDPVAMVDIHCLPSEEGVRIKTNASSENFILCNLSSSNLALNLWHQGTAGVIYWYDNGTLKNVIHANGNTYFSGGDVTIGTTASTGGLFSVSTGTNEAHEAVNIDQNDANEAFIGFDGTFDNVAGVNAGNLSTLDDGAGGVDGPKSGTPGWNFEGMLLIEINGSKKWIPYYDRQE